MNNKTIKEYVTGFLPISDRVMIITLNMSQSKIKTFQLYAPTSDKDKEEMEQFYNELERAFDTTNLRDYNDWGFKCYIRKGESEENFIGNFGLGLRNQRGERDFIHGDYR